MLVYLSLFLCLVNLSAGETLGGLLGALPDGTYSTFKGWAIDTNLANQLASSSDLTLFLPTNDAITEFLNRNPTFNPNDSQQKSRFCFYHLITGVYQTTDLINELLLPTFGGDKVRANIYNSDLTVNGVLISSVVGERNVVANNGIYHVLPQSAMSINIAPIGEFISVTPNFSILSLIVGTVGEISVAFGNPNSTLTLFAPTNQAFNQLDSFLEGQLFRVRADIPIITNILKYHILGSTRFKVGLTTGSYTTLHGDSISVSDSTVNSASIVTTDIPVTNGVVHIIDSVLLPENVFPTIYERVVEANFSTLQNWIDKPEISSFRTQIENRNNNYTFFAPSNQAIVLFKSESPLFSESNNQQVLNFLNSHTLGTTRWLSDFQNDELVQTLLTGFKIRINKYMVNSVEITTANGRVLSPADIYCDNGAFHRIEAKALIVRPDTISEWIPKQNNLAQITLLLNAAPDISSLLNEEGPFTFFVPTDVAFASVGLTAQSILDTINSTENTLQELLKYHAVSGTFYAVGLQAGIMTTLDGRTISISSTQSVNGISIAVSDVTVTNGVVHLIDGILTPSAKPTTTPPGNSSPLLTISLTTTLFAIFILLL